jgi:uncharacterized protein YidB (DUF937 family)
MSLLGNIVGQLAGNVAGGGQSAQLLQLVTGLVTSGGGIDGLVGKFTQAGLGNIVQSWVGKGSNLPVSGDQIMQVFGAQQIGQIAQQAGLQPPQAANGLAQLLPTVVDKLTPDGASVGGAALDQGVAGLLKNGAGGLGIGDLAGLFR